MSLFRRPQLTGLQTTGHPMAAPPDPMASPSLMEVFWSVAGRAPTNAAEYEYFQSIVNLYPMHQLAGLLQARAETLPVSSVQLVPTSNMSISLSGIASGLGGIVKKVLGGSGGSGPFGGSVPAGAIPKLPTTFPTGGPGGTPSGPGGINAAGLGGLLGTIGGMIGKGAGKGGAAIGAAGTAIAKVSGGGKGKIIRDVVGGIAGYYVLDKALGWIFKPGNPPSRRMNVLNPRALTRANRRLVGFSHKVRPVLRDLGYTVSSTRKAKGGKPKRKCR